MPTRRPSSLRTRRWWLATGAGQALASTRGTRRLAAMTPACCATFSSSAKATSLGHAPELPRPRARGVARAVGPSAQQHRRLQDGRCSQAGLVRHHRAHGQGDGGVEADPRGGPRHTPPRPRLQRDTRGREGEGAAGEAEGGAARGQAHVARKRHPRRPLSSRGEGTPSLPLSDERIWRCLLVVGGSLCLSVFAECRAECACFLPPSSFD
ncbi:hypothetical protein EMIHUDRAFT_443325 [Emiliania huxleyi CCMP1516]|uniref:Uncharacterized protein n=2 Tax=Emiliania huxleyi TaxID=2903 RepID=A0A0D3JTR2_EMIH1|nr:hypothetical protein EMIHUDRAFT_443325 [Emiliania huxleyi CCMP1516]EOD26897.1 hypothetical protein EMIHUDRAFT_443325 [Emiliania huxleyi CCMP1516]|eukprot:XP_005779326.1 hypothetical protein EMIHUDRAFT_443325 [Emiliania huxleyi CCMP1516]